MPPVLVTWASSVKQAFQTAGAVPATALGAAMADQTPAAPETKRWAAWWAADYRWAGLFNPNKNIGGNDDLYGERSLEDQRPVLAGQCSRRCHGDNVYLARHANFHGAAFAGGASFNEICFAGGARFKSAAYSDKFIFDSTILAGKTDFGGANFSFVTNFVGACFAGDVILVSANFLRDAKFYGTKFADISDFDHSKSLIWKHTSNHNSKRDIK
jgi:hypothetical protein